ncbi:hypothetical protein R69608_03940 [Paraburkholderia nemoris]|uniref:Uncharacterized protein n=1 Tax=Paraburkholderia nemoris TaxID=2793076 RepID=A0ABM8R3I8_9BURK|nr:hypothetical protein R75777_00582 [Paraburkholderia nemoris]CAE6730759.1 hypothetical protein R69776_01971 [Paraburkholderia nemoris]CAE6918147.1 hypothetical protein R69608_03940 [Paraburkholderia nemoris]
MAAAVMLMSFLEQKHQPKHSENHLQKHPEKHSQNPSLRAERSPHRCTFQEIDFA